MARDKYKKGREAYVLLEFGLGGFTGYYPDNPRGHCSGYDTRVKPYLGDLAQGGIVLDKIELIQTRSDAVSLVINMPMVSLAEDMISPCPEITDIAMALAQGEFKTLATMKRLNPAWKGLDTVDVQTYVTLWENEGCAVGQRKGNKIYWRKGLLRWEEDIPRETDRWKD